MVWVGYSRLEIISWVPGPSVLPDPCHIVAGNGSEKKKKEEGQMGLCLEDIRSANARGPD